MTESALPLWITPQQFGVLSRVLDALEALACPYVATGGLAGNLHGSEWPLHDIDLDADASALPALAARFAGAVIFGPAPYRDDEFVLRLLTLRFGDVGVDIGAADSVRLVDTAGREVPAPTRLDAFDWRTLGGRRIPTMPLPALLAYKRVIGRTSDVADLERLQRRQPRAESE